jgi:hypothetical protein
MSKPTYSSSAGIRYSTSQIDRRVSEAKREIAQGFNSCCERCQTNQGRLTMSHIVSVKYAKENGMTELCWDKNNMELLCEKHHLEIESRTALERMEFYLNRL